MDFLSYMEEKKSVVASFLSCNLRDGCPSILYESMRYGVFPLGKGMRPFLCLATYEAAGGKEDCIVPLACALELINVYTLMHDDLPCMDDDDMRRGKPSHHKVYGEACTVLTGTALLTLAFEWVSSVKELDARVRVLLIQELAKMVEQLHCGQMVDLQSTGNVITPEALDYMYTHKTGVFFKASVRMGALAANAPIDFLAAVSNYGSRLGLALQVINDILDVEGDPAILGKRVGADQRKKKVTYPSMYGLAQSKEYARQFIAEAIDALRQYGEEVEMLRAFARYSLSRRN